MWLRSILAVAQAPFAVLIRSLAGELPYAVGTVIKIKKKKKTRMKSWFDIQIKLINSVKINIIS